MNFILAPFTALMLRMKYAQKFVLISLLFLIPLGILVSIWSLNLERQIKTTKQEIVGSEYIQVLMPFMLNVQQHRGLANGFLNGDADSKAKLADKEKDIEADMAKVNEVDSRSGEALQTAAHWKELQSNWKALQAAMPTLSAKESYDRHSALIEQTLDLIVQAADVSNLTLDPEMDSFYMMDVMVHRLPLLIELSGQARGELNGALASKKLTEDNKINGKIKEVLITSAIADVEKAMAATAAFNPSLGEVLKSPGEKNVQAAKSFIEIMDKNVLSARTLTMKPSDYFAEGTKTIEASNQFFKVVSTELDKLLNDRVERLTGNRTEMIAIVGLAILLAALFFFAFYRSVRMTIRDLQQGAERLASGDLSKPLDLKTKDELKEVGVAFNNMSAALGSILRRNQEIAEQVAASSEELSAVSTESTSAMQLIAVSVQTVAEGAEQQKKASEENAHAMSEMAIGVAKIANTASDVSELATDASGGARLSEEKLKLAVGQMKTIRHAVQESADVVTRLGEHSKDIGAFVSTIKRLSTQTNLLALNANIEAARAGEYGKGFKVVASEIGQLAGQTQQSVESITELVDTILALVDGAVTSMKETAGEAEQGLTAIEETDRAIGGILHSIQQVAHQIQEVSAASEQMSASTHRLRRQRWTWWRSRAALPTDLRKWRRRPSSNWRRWKKCRHPRNRWALVRRSFRTN